MSLGICDFLYGALNCGEIPGIRWINRKDFIFAIDNSPLSMSGDNFLPLVAHAFISNICGNLYEGQLTSNVHQTYSSFYHHLNVEQELGKVQFKGTSNNAYDKYSSFQFLPPYLTTINSVDYRRIQFLFREFITQHTVQEGLLLVALKYVMKSDTFKILQIKPRISAGTSGFNYPIPNSASSLQGVRGKKRRGLAPRQGPGGPWSKRRGPEDSSPPSVSIVEAAVQKVAPIQGSSQEGTPLDLSMNSEVAPSGGEVTTTICPPNSPERDSSTDSADNDASAGL